MDGASCLADGLTRAPLLARVALPGPGHGLPLCRALIELHDGCMELESEVGKGTRVTMSLPPERVVT
jgi:two-component system cell cycle sensor histidine kinase PleC